MSKLGFSVIRENYRSGEVVERSKTLWDIWGVTYIYGMFYRFGLIAYCLNVTIQSHAKLRSANACIQADKQFCMVKQPHEQMETDGFAGSMY